MKLIKYYWSESLKGSKVVNLVVNRDFTSLSVENCGMIVGNEAEASNSINNQDVSLCVVNEGESQLVELNSLGVYENDSITVLEKDLEFIFTQVRNQAQRELKTLIELKDSIVADVCSNLKLPKLDRLTELQSNLMSLKAPKPVKLESCIMCSKEIDLSLDKDYEFDEQGEFWCGGCFRTESDTGEVV